MASWNVTDWWRDEQREVTERSATQYYPSEKKNLGIGEILDSLLLGDHINRCKQALLWVDLTWNVHERAYMIWIRGGQWRRRLAFRLNSVFKPVNIEKAGFGDGAQKLRLKKVLGPFPAVHDVWYPDSAWIQRGHAMDTSRTEIWCIKSEVSDGIGRDMLPILDYRGIIVCDKHSRLLVLWSRYSS